MPVGHLGPEDVATVEPDAQVSEAVDRLESESVGAVVVADGDEPIGVVTDRDVALAVGGDEPVGTEPVRSVMSEDPVTLHEDEEAMELSRTIDEHDVRRVPIVDDDGELTGIATADDLVGTVGEQLDRVANTIEAQSPEYSP
ncbi:CBS domain-containing protein [Halorarum salinum]|uniref:CBS domain-containing protein n=1 Tax=Halorarum salinum TaxID=2743089 RepID=A0A7D5LAL6_9EURY|nr:CBS domain-containing protein [Halobaculum salinum]QLG61549.1 CBS domain-containing protein [Halobaculum salinum]